MPMEARGLFSGILQQGYALGYLIAAVFNLYIVPNSSQGWKALFFIGAGLTLSVAIARVFFPESKQFIEAKRSGEQATGRKKVKLFWQDGKSIMKEYWKRALYAIVMMGISSHVIFFPRNHSLILNGQPYSISCPTPHKTCTRLTCNRLKDSAQKCPPRPQSLPRLERSLVAL